MMNGKCGRFEVKDGWFHLDESCDISQITLTPEEKAFLDAIMGGKLIRKARFKMDENTHPQWHHGWALKEREPLFFYRCPGFCGRGFIVSSQRSSPDYLKESSISSNYGGDRWAYQVGLLWVGGSKPRRRKTDG